MLGFLKPLAGLGIAILLSGGAIAAGVIFGGSSSREEEYRGRGLYKYATKTFTYLKNLNSSPPSEGSGLKQVTQSAANKLAKRRIR